MKPLLLLTALLLSSFLMAQNTEKTNSMKHNQLEGIPTPKGFQLWENFEDMLMPPTGWQLQQGTTPATWDTASFDPAWGSGYVRCPYDETLSGPQNEYLISRVVDMRTFASASLTFYFQFSKYWGIDPMDNYDLLVLVSVDSAQTFTDTLWTELDSDTSAWQSFEWVPVQIDLASYIGTEKFALAFVYSGFDGAEASIDMVAIETVGGMAENDISINVYPNPANNIINIESAERGNLILSDMQGRVVLKKEFEQNDQIDVSAFEPGRYILSLYTQEDSRSIPVEIVH